MTATRYAELYHPISPSALKSVVILGTATPMIVLSIATSIVPNIKDISRKCKR